jgi:hypothetical protein
MMLHWSPFSYPWFWRPRLARRVMGGWALRWGYLYALTGDVHVS